MDRDANRSRKLDPNETEFSVRTHVHKKYYEFFRKWWGKFSRKPIVILVCSFLKYISLCYYYTVSCHINNTELTNHSGRRHEIHYWLPSPPSTNGDRAVKRHSSANILDGSHHHHLSLMSLVATQSEWAIMKLTKLVLIKTVLIQKNDR
jgi:hypothetical protein